MLDYTELNRIYEFFESYPKIKSGTDPKIEKELKTIISLIESNNTTKEAWEKSVEYILKKQNDAESNIYIRKTLASNSAFVEAVQRIASITTPSHTTSVPSPISITPPIAIKSTIPMKTPHSTKRKFENWRSDQTPDFKNAPALEIPLEEINCPLKFRAQVKEHCLQQYHKAMQLMEHSVCDVALQYVRKDPQSQKTKPFRDKFREDNSMTSPNKPGALLRFANAYSQRYLDLYDAYIDWEMQKDIPMLPVTAGQMKLHGFTSEDIIKMQPSCVKYSEISDNIMTLVGNDPIKYGKVIAAMSNMNKEIKLEEFILDDTKRENFLSFLPSHEKTKIGLALAEEFKKYKALPEKELLDRAHFLMHDFAHLEYKDIAMQLYYVGIMKPDYNATKEERIQMEIRHRVAGDMSIHQNSPGTLGGNPLAYLNMLQYGEKDNPEAEFRNKMYFVYMNNHFANAVIRDQERIDFINKHLEANNKGWKLDQEFIDEMNSRGAKYIPPVFRYGANAAINRQLRDMRSHEEVEEFYRLNPNITIREAMEGLADINSYHRMKLSDRELLNQIGEWDWEETDKNRSWISLNFGTGAAIFKLYDKPTPEMGPSAIEYLKQVNEFNLPVYAGISGTLDQSTAMAGLVGLGVDADLQQRELELQTIKMAYLGFMLPGRDHSVHEIMQSSKSYGLDYVPGPGYQKYVYPADPSAVTELEKQQMLRGSHFPEYYLSKEYAQETLKHVQQQAQSSTHGATVSSDSQPSHYIGITVAGTKLERAIKQWRKEIPDAGTDWAPPSNLHITIGWTNAHLTPLKQEKIAEALAPVLDKYQDLAFNIKGVEMWGHGHDIIVTLDDTSNQLQQMRKEIKQTLEKMKIGFDFEPQAHVTIGHTNKEVDSINVQQAFSNPPNDTYSFNRCGIMHTEPKRWKTITDREIPFEKQAKKQKEHATELAQEFVERNEKAKVRDKELEVQKLDIKHIESQVPISSKEGNRVGALTSLKDKHSGSKTALNPSGKSKIGPSPTPSKPERKKRQNQ